MTSAEPSAVVEEYFARVRARELSLVDLFHDDARLLGLGSTRKGKPAIREFYRDVIERAGPSPTVVGSLLAEAGRVAAEIRIELANGSTVHAIDLFEVDAGRIRTLSYFLASQ